MRKVLSIFNALIFINTSFLMLENSHSMEHVPEVQHHSTNELHDEYYKELLSIMAPSIEAGMKFYDKYHHQTFHRVEDITQDLKDAMAHYKDLLKQRSKMIWTDRQQGYALRLLPLSLHNQNLQSKDLKEHIIYFKKENDMLTYVFRNIYYFPKSSDRWTQEMYSGNIDLNKLGIHKDEALTQEILNRYQHQILEEIKSIKRNHQDNMITWSVDLETEHALKMSIEDLVNYLSEGLQFGARVDPMQHHEEYKEQLGIIQAFQRRNKPDSYMAKLFMDILLDIESYRDLCAARSDTLKVVNWLKEKKSEGLNAQGSHGSIGTS